MSVGIDAWFDEQWAATMPQSHLDRRLADGNTPFAIWEGYLAGPEALVEEAQKIGTHTSYCSSPIHWVHRTIPRPEQRLVVWRSTLPMTGIFVPPY